MKPLDRIRLEVSYWTRANPGKRAVLVLRGTAMVGEDDWRAMPLSDRIALGPIEAWVNGRQLDAANIDLHTLDNKPKSSR